MSRSSLALARRALRNFARRPQFLAPMLIFPSLLLAVNSSGLARSTDLPGFPVVHGFLDFQLAAAMTQSLLLGGVSAGIAMALEIEGGFFDRLVTSPIPRSAIVFGRLAATAVLATLQITFFILVGLIFGAHIVSGLEGVLVVYAIGILAGTGFGALGVMLALYTRNASTVQGIFPVVLVALFLSSAFFPRNLLSQPAESFAAYNPLSYIADGMREPIISNISGTVVLEGLAAAAVIVAASVCLSLFALRGRLREP